MGIIRGVFKRAGVCNCYTTLPVNKMMAVAVKNFLNFLGSSFLIIRQNVSMATSAMLHCGLTSVIEFTTQVL